MPADRSQRGTVGCIVDAKSERFAQQGKNAPFQGLASCRRGTFHSISNQTQAIHDSKVCFQAQRARIASLRYAQPLEGILNTTSLKGACPILNTASLKGACPILNTASLKDASRI